MVLKDKWIYNNILWQGMNSLEKIIKITDKLLYLFVSLVSRVSGFAKVLTNSKNNLHFIYILIINQLFCTFRHWSFYN